MQNVISYVGFLVFIAILISCSRAFSPDSKNGKKTRFYTMRMTESTFNSVKSDEQLSFSIMYNGRYSLKDVVTLECYAYNKTSKTFRRLDMDAVDEKIKFKFDRNFSTSTLKPDDKAKIDFDNKYLKRSILFTPDTLPKYSGFIHYRVSIEKTNDSLLAKSLLGTYLDPCPPIPCIISEN